MFPVFAAARRALKFDNRKFICAVLCVKVLFSCTLSALALLATSIANRSKAFSMKLLYFSTALGLLLNFTFESNASLNFLFKSLFTVSRSFSCAFTSSATAFLLLPSSFALPSFSPLCSSATRCLISCGFCSRALEFSLSLFLCSPASRPFFASNPVRSCLYISRLKLPTFLPCSFIMAISLSSGRLYTFSASLFAFFSKLSAFLVFPLFLACSASR